MARFDLRRSHFSAMVETRALLVQKEKEHATFYHANYKGFHTKESSYSFWEKRARGGKTGPCTLK